MRTTWLLTALLAVAVAGASGCGSSSSGDDDSTGDDGGGTGGGDGGQACIDGLTGIALTPSTTNVTLTGGPASPITFTATGSYAGGGTQPIDGAQLTWTASRTDDTPPGTVDAGAFAPNPAAGGTVTVTATDGCVSGSATVTLFLDVSVGPGDPAAWDGTPTTAGAPTIVYPSDRTRFPRNIYRTLFQWQRAGFTEFRLRFVGPGSTVTVYTDGTHPTCADADAAGCWEADETAWSYVAGSNAGEVVEWTVDALDRSTVPPTVRRGGPIQIGFSRRDVRGAIFYWSTTNAGIRRASVTSEFPEDYIAAGTTYSAPDDEVQCVACHVVSRNGRYLAAPVAAQSGKSLWITEVTESAPPTPLVRSVENTDGHGFATISPDDAYVVAAWGGEMWMVERETGAYVAPISLGTDVEGTHPDWSPDGDRLVFATGKGDAPGGASIATIAYQGGTSWGAPTTLVAADAQTKLFPQFSFDGEWIAYASGRGGHGDNDAQLWVVGKDGGAPVELVAANRVVNNATTDGRHQNSQPTWAPDGDFYWVAFNSKREYGVVLGGGTQQIWVAAIDPAALAAGVSDPSYPAFRLQFQGLDEDNHRAFWTEDVRDPIPPPDGGVPSPDAGQCIAAGQVCVPGADVCCDASYLCDTHDDGATYTCVPPFIP
jgi:WD40 repeat protein